MKLEVGMYVRTKGGFINKIISFKSTITNDYVELEDEYYANKKDILKASYNIIDLIEVGDYVNGFKIGSLFKNSVATTDDAFKPLEQIFFYENDIKSIVTKEQFESMSYKVSK